MSVGTMQALAVCLQAGAVFAWEGRYLLQIYLGGQTQIEH